MVFGIRPGRQSAQGHNTRGSRRRHGKRAAACRWPGHSHLGHVDAAHVLAAVATASWAPPFRSCCSTPRSVRFRCVAGGGHDPSIRVTLAVLLLGERLGLPQLAGPCWSSRLWWRHDSQTVRTCHRPQPSHLPPYDRRSHGPESVANQRSDVRANANAGLDPRGARDPLSPEAGLVATAQSAREPSARQESRRAPSWHCNSAARCPCVMLLSPSARQLAVRSRDESDRWRIHMRESGEVGVDAEEVRRRPCADQRFSSRPLVVLYGWGSCLGLGSSEFMPVA